jgi:ribosomal protein S18 acetylase RimI-like enzyme
MIVRACEPRDRAALWSILEPVIRAGETYALPRDMAEADALAYWLDGRDVFVLEEEGQLLGTSYVRPNQMGGGCHVANGGYVTAEHARGRGIARTLCVHSIGHARARGFRAMQFNFVVSSNEQAVRLWQSCGFEIVGRLPGAFDHPRLGYVDALVMFRTL